MVSVFLLHAALAAPAPGGQAYYAPSVSPGVTTEHVVRVRCARCGRVISETSSHAGPFTAYREPSAPPIQQMSYQQPAQPRVVHYGSPIQYGSHQYNAPQSSSPIRYVQPVRSQPQVRYSQPPQSRPIFINSGPPPRSGRRQSQRPSPLLVAPTGPS